MKKLLTITLFAALALSAFGQAAGTYPTSLNGATNNVLATATNTYAIQEIVSDYSGAAATLTLSGKPSASSTGNVVFRLAVSGDGGNTFESIASTNAVLALNGAGTATSVKILLPTGVSAYQISAVENTNSVYITNLTATWGLWQPKYVIGR